MHYLHRPICILMLSIICAGCDKRGSVRAEIESADADLKVKQEDLLNLQNESNQLTKTLGRHSMADQGLIDQLSKEAAALHAGIASLKEEKEALEKKNTETQSATQAYLNKHARL